MPLTFAFAFKSLRDRASAWTGAFVMVAATSTLVAVVSSQLETAILLPGDAGDVVRGYSLPMGLLALTVTAVVLPTVLSRTVSVQTRDYALLRLAGATPRQVRSLLSLQLVILTFVALPVGLLFGYPAALLFFDFSSEQSALLWYEELTYGVGTIIATTVVVVLFALLAGLGAARKAARAPILVAVVDNVSATRARRGSWIARSCAAGLGVVVAVGLVWFSFGLSGGTISTTILNVLGLGALALFSVTLAVAAVASLILPTLTRAWTRVVPSRSATWLLARRAVQAQLAATSSGVLPLFVSLTLVGGVFSLLWTADAAFVAAGRLSEGQSATNVGGVLLILCGGLFIAAVGAAVSILVASRDRQREYTMRRAIGEPAKGTIGSAIAESFIFVTSSVILAMLVIAFVVTVTALSMSHYVGPIAARFELGMPAVIASVGFALIALVVIPPAIHALRETDIGSSLSSD